MRAFYVSTLEKFLQPSILPPMKSHSLILAFGAVFGFMSVAMGAFAAHGLKTILDPKALGWIDTAAQYQMSHSLALIALGFALKYWPTWSMLKYSAYGFSLGVILFSGSLYAMAFTGVKALAIVTPLGGLSLLVGWTLLLLAVKQQPQDN